jgi:hypothetical protein
MMLHKQTKIHERLDLIMAPKTELDTPTSPCILPVNSQYTQKIQRSPYVLDSPPLQEAGGDLSGSASPDKNPASTLKLIAHRKDEKDIEPCRPHTRFDRIPPVVKEIIYWTNKKETDSHCLARLYRDGSKLIVVLSEVKSNIIDNSCPGISSEFVSAANSVYKKFPRKFKSVPSENILWVSHYGSFSRHESYDTQDYFDRESLRLKGGVFERWGNESRLKGDEFKSELGNIEIMDTCKIITELLKDKRNVDT